MYEAEKEDFASDDASRLDTWVFDHVVSFFEKAKGDKKLRERLLEDRIVFFLHLLGIDTNGHAHKPYSKYVLWLSYRAVFFCPVDFKSKIYLIRKDHTGHLNSA